MSDSTRGWSIFDVPNLGDLFLVLVCYLDDSSNDGVVTSLGGYIASRDDWVKYESLVPAIYEKYGITILHTKDLHGNKGQFKGWPIEKRKAFVQEIFDAAKQCNVVGISVCARNSLGKKFNQSTDQTARISTLGLLFARVVMSMATEDSIYHIPHPPGDVSVIIEKGNKNNKGILQHYDEVTEHGASFDFVKSLSFVGKQDCYAIHLADFWAFYSRRMGSRILNGDNPIEIGEARPLRNACEPLHAIATYRSPHHLKVIDRVDDPDQHGHVLTSADSYSLDPEDWMYFGDPALRD